MAIATRDADDGSLGCLSRRAVASATRRTHPAAWNRGPVFEQSERIPHLRFEGRTALLSLEGMRVLDWFALDALERSLFVIRSRIGLKRLVINNPAPDFMVGVDTPWIVARMEADDFSSIRRFVERGQRCLRAFDALPLTTVMAIDGLATGAGAEWVAVADAVVATPRTRIGLPETGLGIYPALGGTQRVPRRIGLGAARWMVLTGTYVTAAEGCGLGWIDRVVEPAELLEAACAIVPTRPRAAEVPFAPLLRDVSTPLLEAFSSQTLEELSEATQSVAELQRAASYLRHRAPVALHVADDLLCASTRISLAAGLAREVEELATVYATRDALTGLRAGAAGRRAARFRGQ